MKTNKLTAVISSVLIGSMASTTAMADPVASAQSIVTVENFQLFKGAGGVDGQLSANDFTSLSVSSTQQTVASVGLTANGGVISSSSTGETTVSNAVVGTPTGNVASKVGTNNTVASPSNFVVANTFPMTGNFSASSSNDVGSPISDFFSSAPTAIVRNASYASLDTFEGVAGTSTNSSLSADYTFSGLSGVMNLQFDAGAYVAAFLSATAEQFASAVYTIKFNLTEDLSTGGTGLSLLAAGANINALGFLLGDTASDVAPGEGATDLGLANSLVNLDGTLGTTHFSLDTVALDATSLYHLTANITTTANVERVNNVPEPESMLMLGLGLLGFVASRKRTVRFA